LSDDIPAKSAGAPVSKVAANAAKRRRQRG
jgi:hypothetical protein